MQRCLPAFSLCYAAGVLIGAWAAEGALIAKPSSVWGLVVASVMLAMIGGWRRLVSALLAAGLLLGAASALSRMVVESPSCDVARAIGRRPVRLLGTTVAPARRVGEGWRQLLRVSSLERDQKRRAACGVVELWIPAQSSSPPPAGQQLWLSARLRRPQAARNPLLAHGALRVLSERVRARAYLEAHAYRALDPPRSRALLWSLRGKLRRGLAERIADHDARAVISALMFGERAGLSDQLRRAFAYTGVSHLLAISGLHLALVALGAVAFCRFCLLRSYRVAARYDVGRLSALVGILAAIAYTLFTGAAHSTSRACLMVGALLLADLCRRPRDFWRPLCLALLVLLIVDPLALFSPGFQLSFSAVLAIALAQRSPSVERWGWRLLRSTVAATLVTLPLCAHHFGQAALLGIVVNLVAIPFVSFVLLPLVLLLALELLVGGSLLAPLVEWLTSGFVAACGRLGSAPWAAVAWRPGWLLTLSACALALLLVSGRVRRRRGLALMLLAVAAVAVAGDQLKPPALRLTFLDVGQGDASLVQFPNGTSMLVDGGGSYEPRYDVGRARVVPYLRAAGIQRLDVVVGTHLHADHVGGLRAVLRELPVGELWLCPRHDERSPWWHELRALAQRQGVPIVAPHRLVRGSVSVEPLWPDAVAHRGQAASACGGQLSTNDASVVLRVRYGRSSALLAGDIEAQVERQLVDRYQDGLSARLLKVAHHGSATSTTDQFVSRVLPRIAVISCGRENRFAFPDREVISRLDRIAAAVWRTDLRGGVIAHLFADGDIALSDGFSLLR